MTHLTAPCQFHLHALLVFNMPFFQDVGDSILSIYGGLIYGWIWFIVQIWFLVGGDWNMVMIFPFSWEFSFIPIDIHSYVSEDFFPQPTRSIDYPYIIHILTIYKPCKPYINHISIGFVWFFPGYKKKTPMLSLHLLGLPAIASAPAPAVLGRSFQRTSMRKKQRLSDGNWRMTL